MRLSLPAAVLATLMLQPATAAFAGPPSWPALGLGAPPSLQAGGEGPGAPAAP